MSCSQGSSTDAIYRTNGDSLDWWQNKKRGWHTLRWLLMLLALLLVVGLVIYFLMIGECLYTNIDSENKDIVKSATPVTGCFKDMCERNVSSKTLYSKSKWHEIQLSY
jgi:cytoskeletal protein RodZ